MRLYYWSNSSFPSRNANIVNVLYMSDSFSRQIKTYLFLFSKENLSIIDDNFKFDFNEGLKIIILGKYSIVSLVYNFFKFILFSNFCFRQDIIYTRSIYIYFISYIFNLKVYYEIHNTQRLNLQKFIFQLGNRNKNSKLIFITKVLLENYKFKGDYFILPSGSVVNMDHSSLLSKKMFILSRKNPLTICYVGSDHPGKGVDRVFMLSKNLPNFNFEIVGVERGQYDWPDNCRVRGRLSNSEALELMKKCEIFLLPNHKNIHIYSQRNIGEFTSPLKLFEYMSSFGCVLASNINVLREVLNEENSILLTESKYVEEASISIQELNINREKLLNLANSSFQDFINNYSWDIRAKKIYDTFD